MNLRGERKRAVTRNLLFHISPFGYEPAALKERNIKIALKNLEILLAKKTGR